ncbi:MAG: HNH endonuclease [Oscillospiraceae bacterium]|nr:HNH endonuclease [Oscillospiraceae bacterium]
MLTYIKLFVDYLDAIEPLGDAERGRLFTALLEYARTGTVPQLCGNERFIFPMMRAQIDRDREKANANTGENHWNWKGGVTPENQRQRNSKEYKEWRKSVFQRDNYICQSCGEKGGTLNAHHLNPWARFPEQRFLPENGITLCKTCHNEIHSKRIKTK